MKNDPINHTQSFNRQISLPCSCTFQPQKVGQILVCNCQKRYPSESSHLRYSLDAFWMHHLCLGRQQVQQYAILAKKQALCHNLEELNYTIITINFIKYLEKKFIGNYIMNTFECKYHSIDTTSTLNTLVNSPTSHFSNHLKTRRNVINSEIYICLFLIEPTLKIYKENKPLEQACHGLLGSQNQWHRISLLLCWQEQV